MESEEPTYESENASGPTDKDAASSQPASDKPKPAEPAADQAPEKKPATNNPFASLLQLKTISPAKVISDTQAKAAASAPLEPSTNEPSESPAPSADEPPEAQISTQDYDSALSEVIQHLLHTPDAEPIEDEPEPPEITAKTPEAAVPAPSTDARETPSVGVTPELPQPEVLAPPKAEPDPIIEVTPKLTQAAAPASPKSEPQSPSPASPRDQAETPIFAAIADLMQAPVPAPIKDRPDPAIPATPATHPASDSGSSSNPTLVNMAQMPSVPAPGISTGTPATAEPRKVKLQSFGERMVQSVARKTHNALAALEKLAGGSPSERLTPDPTRAANSPAVSAPTPQAPRMPPAAPSPDLSEASIDSAIQDLLQAPVAPPSLQSQIGLPKLQKPAAAPNTQMPLVGANQSASVSPQAAEVNAVKPTFGQRMVQSIARTTHNALAALENLSGFGAQSERLTPEPTRAPNQASIAPPISTSQLPAPAPVADSSETSISSAIQDLLQAPTVVPPQNVTQSQVNQSLPYSPEPAVNPILEPPTAGLLVEPQVRMRWQAPGQKLVQSIATKTHNALQALKKSAGFGTERLTPEPDEEPNLNQLDDTGSSSHIEEEIDEILRLKRAHELELREKARDLRKQRLSRVTSEEDLAEARKHAELMKAGMSDPAATTKPPPMLVRFLMQNKAGIAAVTILMILGAAGFFGYKDLAKNALIGSAEHALQNEQYAEAQRDAERGLASFPKEALFHFYRGQALMQLGNETAALDELNLAQNVRSNDLKIAALRANLLVQLGQPQAALSAFRQLIAGQYGDKAANYAGKATVELMLGHPKDALTDINAAVQHKPGTTKYVRDRAIIYSQLQDYAKAINDWNEVIAQHPQDARAYAERGNAEFAAKRTDKALADLAQSMKIGQSAKAYYYRGIIRAELKQYASAIADLNSALHLTEGKTKSAFDAANLVAIFTAGDVLRERAKVEMNLGKYREASGDLQQAIKKGSDNSDTRIHLAECDEKLGDWSDAYANYSAAIKLAPEQAELYVKRGIVSTKQHNFDQAERDLQSAVIQNPNNLAAYMARGALYAEQKRYDDAYSDFNHVLRMEPNNIEARRQLAQIEKSKHSSTMGTPPNAVATQEAPTAAPATQNEQAPMVSMQSGVTAMAQLPEPSSSSPEMQYGYRLMVSGDAAGAINEFTLAVRKNPDNVEARRYLAHALASMGRTADVIAQLQLISSRLTPSDGVMLSAAYEQTGNKRAAATLFQRLTRANPTLSLMRLDLAKIYAASGDTVLLKAACEQGMRMELTEHQREEFNQLWRQVQQSQSSAKAQH
jgi:tetratricopeptide (TPR) repeat protein